MKKKTIAIIASVDQEVAWLRDHLGLRTTLQFGNLVVQGGESYGFDIFLCISGVGAVNMATAVTALILKLCPDYVLVIGTGGGFSESAVEPLGITIATQEIAPQIGVESPRPSTPPLPLAFANNNITLDSSLAATAASVIEKNQALGRAVLGPFLTVSTVTASPATAKAYHSQYRPVIENMEGFGAAYSCKLFGIPLLELRVSSNYVGDRDKRHWHLKEAAHKAQKAAHLLLKQEVFH